jgi:uncharacterized protein (DUF1778 family)
MPRIKDVTLTLRTTAEIKSLLRQAAELEHRSIASMVEVLVLSYASQHGLTTDTPPTTGQNVSRRQR